MVTLLITDVTGFLSGTALEKTLHQGTRLDLLLLMRADNPKVGLEQVKESMRKFSIVGEKLTTLHPQRILLGDPVSSGHFLNDPRLNQVTYILNCATVASFGSNPLTWRVNVEGTLRLAQRTAQVEGLQRFLHISTVTSRSPRPDSPVTKSAELQERAEHLVEYTHSRSAIEQLMQQHCPTLPLVIARPSIVMGHTHHGYRPSSSILWVFSVGLMLQEFLCPVENRIDVIPVGYCADALLMLLNQPLAHDEVVHISAGEEGSIKFAEIDRAMTQALEQAPMGDKYAQVGYDMLVRIRHELKGIFGPCNECLMLKAMRLYSTFVTSNVRFSNDKLLGTGMPKPLHFTDCTNRCVETTRELSIPQQMAVDFR